MKAKQKKAAATAIFVLFAFAMPTSRAIFLALIFALPAAAQMRELPDAPVPKETVLAPARTERQEKIVDKKFIWTITALAAAKTADGITTQRMLDRGLKEMNPIYGSAHPSAARIAGTNAAYFAGEVTMAYFLKKYGRGKWWSKIWMVEPAFQIQEHVRCAVHNEHLPNKSAK